MRGIFEFSQPMLDKLSKAKRLSIDFDEDDDNSIEMQVPRMGEALGALKFCEENKKQGNVRRRKGNPARCEHRAGRFASRQSRAAENGATERCRSKLTSTLHRIAKRPSRPRYPTLRIGWSARG